MSNLQAKNQVVPNAGIPKEDIAGLEFRHATYSKNEDKDVLVVKEYIHTKDGRRIPNVRCVYNYERPFWVTHKGLQVHKEKREWESLENVKEFRSTQANLPRAVAAALGRPGVSDMRQLKRSPYIYGIDIPPSSLLKHDYVKRWPKFNDGHDAKVAVFDIETDVLDAPTPEIGSGDIICAALTFKDKAILVGTKAFLEGLTNVDEKVQKAFVKYLGKYKEKRGINLEFVLVDNEAHAMQLIFQRAHEWKPDFISIWNMLFDVPKAARVLEKYGFRPEDVLSDPSVPRDFRYYKFTEGPTHMVTDSGKMKPLLGAERWHVVDCTSSFYFVDSMCLYKRIRVQDGNLSGGYSLDNVLDTELGIRKLDFDQIPEGLSRGQWHALMQREYKIEYMIYNLFDCISVEELDEKTGDVSRSFSALCGASDYGRFKSNPKRIADDMHFFCLENKKVIGTFADNVATEFDKYIIEKDGWVVTLQSYLLDEDGARPFDELPDIISNIRAMVADLDIEGTYPNEEDIWNISNETTLCEANRIAGITFEQQRMVGINLSGGTTNAIEICMVGLQMPSPEEYLQQFMTEMQIGLCEPEKDYIDAA